MLDRLGELWRSLRFLLHRGSLDSDLEEEMRFHLEMKAAHHRDYGAAPPDARRLAARQFGNLAALKQQSREAWQWEPLVRFAGDVRLALRQWCKNPVFAAIALATLAVGIGLNTVIFTLVHAVLLAPLPYRDPTRLVSIQGLRARWTTWVSAPDMADLRARTSTFDDLALTRGIRETLTGGEPEQIEGARVSPSLFPLLGATPLLGRAIEPSDDQPSAPSVVLLSHALWQRRFSGDRSVLGKSLTLDGRARTIVGVMPAAFHVPADATYWVPLRLDAAKDGRNDHFFEAVARLRAGATLEQARAEVRTVAAALSAAYPQEAGKWSLDAVSLADHIVGGDVRSALLTLYAAVTLLLVLACANVANLLLSRGLQRRQEMALRAAIGASRGRLARLLLTESLLLAVAGGALGLLLADTSLQGLLAIYPPGLPRASEIRLDPTVLLFTAMLSLVTALLTGLAPAVRLSRADLHAILKPGPRAASRRTALLRSALVTSQVALALVLLICSGLLVRSLLRRTFVSGLDPRNVLIAEINPLSRERLAPILDRIRALPGVTGAGATSSPAYTQMMSIHVLIPGGDPDAGFDPTLEIVTPGYFDALGIPLRRGRLIDRRDIEGSPDVVVIDRALAEQRFPGQDPIGRQIQFVGRKIPWTVAGVVDTVHRVGDYGDTRFKIYVPATQFDFDTSTIAVRTAGAPLKLASSVRAIIRSTEPNLPILRIQSAGDDMNGYVASPRFYTLLLGLFAGIALALAALGVYGVVSFSVGARTHEIGVRTALGATSTAVVRSMMREGTMVVLAGALLGEAGAFAAARVLSATRLLYEITPTDPATFASVSAALIAVAVAACYIPARRAAQVDPAAALRSE